MTLNYQEKYKNGKRVARGIEWTDATWNPIAGCLHECRWEMPDGTIAVCYAENIAENLASSSYPDGFDHHYWKPHHLNAPKKVDKPLKIFVGSMSDVFGHWVPDEQIQALLDVIKDCPQHQFQMLTKNPVRTTKFDIPDNVWIGSSSPPDFMWGNRLSQNQKERMLHRMLTALGQANAKIKWMSFEPLSWDVSPIVKDYASTLDWAVIGAASNGARQYPPSYEDFIALKGVLVEQHVRLFYKGNLKTLEAARTEWLEEFPDYQTITETV